jgi:hypothetical protein
VAADCPFRKSPQKLTFLKLVGRGLDKINNSAIISLNKLIVALIKLIILTKEVLNYAQ